MGSSRRRFTPEFRVEAARRVVDTGRTIAEVARDIGVGEQLLGRWVRAERTADLARSIASDDANLTETERAELIRLRALVREQDHRLREQGEDIEFLKKVSAYFAKEQPK